jgi:hypothetical protein
MSVALTLQARIYHDHNYDSSTKMISFLLAASITNVEAHFPLLSVLYMPRQQKEKFLPFYKK